MISRVASRYAKAVFDSQKDHKRANEIADELSQFAKVMKESNDLQQALTSEAFSAESRKAVLEDIAQHAKISSETTKILLVMSEAKRLDQTEAVADQIRELLFQAADIVPLRVHSAVSLSADEKQSIEGKFSKLLGKKVAADYSVDGTLVGGLKVMAGSRTFDGSVTGWLAQFEEKLIGGTV